MSNNITFYNVTFYTWTATIIILFLTFLFVCGVLTKSRFTIKKTMIIIFSGMVLSALLNITVFLHNHDISFTLSIISLTTYIPAIIVLHILSDSRFFKTVPIWGTGLFTVSVQYLSVKAIMSYMSYTKVVWYIHYTIQLLTLLITMSVICIVTIKYIRKPFNQYIRCSEINWSLPVILMLLITAMFSYFINSPYDSIVSFLMLLTATITFFIIIKLFRTEYTRQQLKKEQQEYEILFELQQKEFMEINHKHELLRDYRHDMRHHLLALANILHDSDNTYAEKYINSLMEGLENTENIIYCKNKILNAILSVYVGKAKKIGCVLDLHISIPEQLNIKDIDLCIVLSNALENAIHACEKEDKRLRYINIKINFHNSLYISIKNGCSKIISFDKNGLPVPESKQKEHGIGLKSIANIVEKYDGIFRCECSNNEFKLNIIMFDVSKEEPASKTVNTKKPASTIFFSIICFCTFLNLSPAAAKTLADIPVIGPAVKVITKKYHSGGWGQNKFKVEEPRVLVDFSHIPEQKSVLEGTKTAVISLSSVLSDILSAKSDTAETSVYPAEPSAGELFIPSDKDFVYTTPTQKSTHSDISGISITTPTQEQISFDTQEAVTTSTAEISDSDTSEMTATSESEPSSFDTSEITVTTEQKNPSSDTIKIPETTQEYIEPDTTIPEKNPALEEGVEEMNKQLNEYIETLRQKYIWYASHKYMGYVSLEAFYTILLNNDDILSIRFDGTLNVGGSAEFSRCFLLNKHTGSIIELADLFCDEADYITPISSYILEQMTLQVENKQGMYYIPGGIWADDKCFKSISEEQNFYINDKGKLVIVFDEYEVAPGSMGCVEFVIPTSVIEAILSDHSFIR